MKRKISFQITIGSTIPEKRYPSEIVFPQGGRIEDKIIEFDTNNDEPLIDAFSALKSEMKDISYHIWYWTWIT